MLQKSSPDIALGRNLKLHTPDDRSTLQTYNVIYQKFLDVFSV